MLAVNAPVDYLALKFPLAAEIKHDGVRCIAAVNLGNVRLYSRNGKYFDNFAEIVEQMKSMKDGVYDGEIVADNFQLLMTRVHADKGKNVKVKVEYKIFDRLTIDEWVQGHSRRTYKERCIDADIGERTIIKNSTELEYYFNYVLKQGKEGLILKSLDGLYVSGKSNYWMKLKNKDTMDMTIDFCEEGTGKYIGMLGAFHCSTVYKGSPVEAAVGTGFTDDQRKAYWNIREKLKGTVAEVEYQELTKHDDNGIRSLRSPTFKCLRTDK